MDSKQKKIVWGLFFALMATVFFAIMMMANCG